VAITEAEPAPGPSTTTPGTPDASGSARFPHLRALDGLRGLAVLLVVFSHFTPGVTPGGFLGVDLFFVLSGFLITSLLVAEHRSSGRIGLGNFWVRRVRRLLPALLLVLFAVGVVSWLREDGAVQHQIALDGLASLFYVANWRFIASGQSYVMQFVDFGLSPLRHMWSLAIEEQFYLLWPLVVLGLAAVVRRWRGATPRSLGRSLAVLCGVMALASAARMVLGAFAGESLDRLYYGTDARLFMILLGSAVGAIAVGRPQLSGRWRSAVIVGGSIAGLAVLVATFTVRTTDAWLYRGGYVGVAVVLCVIMVGTAQSGPNPLSRVLSLRPLVGLGLISYGVYLWHWPISVWLTPASTGFDGVVLFAVRSALTLVVSLASYRLLEQPIRRGELARLGRLQPVAAPLAVGVLALALLVPVAIYPAFPEAPEGEAPLLASSAGYAVAPRCDAPSNDGPVDPNQQLRFQLIGNSLAGEVRDCLTEIMAARGAEHYTVNPPKFLLCNEAPAIEEQINEVKPHFAVLFVFVAYDDRCGTPWHATVDRLIDAWIAAGTHVFLVPTVSVPEGGRMEFQPGADQEREYYEQRAAADPANITAVDAGVFLRDSEGTYLWRMPCVAPDEPGCREDGSAPVRFVDGVHFCTSADFAKQGCIRDEDSAGQRRASSAIALRIIETMSRLQAAKASAG
jgi:peptidoglycan/LPS O-acetylase OafA/YrhL